MATVIPPGILITIAIAINGKAEFKQKKTPEALKGPPPGVLGHR